LPYPSNSSLNKS